MTRKIITTFVYPPIPVRNMDWQAHFDGDEPNDDGHMLTGEGATEAEAIADLIESIDDQAEYEAQIAAVRRAVA